MGTLAQTCILFATTVEQERQRFADIISVRKLPYILHLPANLQETDQMMADNDIDIIITDTSFAEGAFADWLSLWPRPFILMAYFGEERRIDDLIRDEACSYIMRDTDYRHLGSLPTMIRKVLNTRESLDRQNMHLQISERRYLELVSSIPDIVYTLDGKGYFTYINDARSQLGYEPSDLYGKHFSIILDPEDVAKVSRICVLEEYKGKITGVEGAPKLFDERRGGKRMTRNLVIRLKNKPQNSKTPATATVYSYGEITCVGLALPEYEGNSIGTVGIIRDITRRRENELKLIENLRIKETMIKEVHHRVKNNLQVVSSLLSLQSSSIEDVKAKAVFYDSQTQIQSIAMVHEQLYLSDDLQNIDTANYLRSLVNFLFQSFEIDFDKVQSYIECENIYLNVDQAIPLALIVNELISNSIKHGLARSSGSISIILKKHSVDRLSLEVHDSGQGLPVGFEMASYNSLGVQLITALGQQLRGTFSWKTDQGTRFLMEFPYIPPSKTDTF